MTTRLALALGLVAALALTTFAAPTPVYKEPPKPKVPPLTALIEGTWELNQNQVMVGRVIRGGLAVQRKMFIKIKNNTWTYVYSYGNGQETESTKYDMVLDAAQNPASLDLSYQQNVGIANRLVMRGIVKIEGNTMTFAYVYGQQNLERPKHFEPVNVNGGVVATNTQTMTLTRVR